MKRPDNIERNKANAKHRMVKTLAYQSWHAMRDRCLNPAYKDYRNYGGRGITIDPRWDDFLVFLQDMGPRPEGTTLGRKDNDRGYFPDNCRWETQKQQDFNKRTTRMVTLCGETMALKEWSRKLSISHQALRYRIGAGWPEELILSTALDHANRISR